MSNGKKRTSLFGAAGILVAVLIIAAFVVGNNIFEAQAKGTLTIQVMDEPVDLKNLYLTIDWIRIQAEDESWIDLELKPEASEFDLLALQDITETLSVTEIAPGKYSMIQIHVSAAKAMYNGDTSEPVTLTVPSDVIKVLLQPHLELEGEEQTTVLIDLEPYEVSSIAISQSLNLRPVVKAVVSS
jgi:hypothetical protein